MGRIIGTVCTNCGEDKMRWSERISPTERKIKCPTCQDEKTITPDSERVYE